MSLPPLPPPRLADHYCVYRLATCAPGKQVQKVASEVHEPLFISYFSPISGNHGFCRLSTPEIDIKLVQGFRRPAVMLLGIFCPGAAPSAQFSLLRQWLPEPEFFRKWPHGCTFTKSPKRKGMQTTGLFWLSTSTDPPPSSTSTHSLPGVLSHVDF